MDDFLPPIAKGFKVVIFEFELIQMSDVQKVKVFFTFLKSLKEQDKYLSSFKLGSMLVHPFLLESSHPAR